MSERVRQVAARLIRVAIGLKPEAATWEWEIHTTRDPDWDASCMAGGKLLVGTKFVEQLALDDGELATLLGHEIAHALAEHHREELSEVVLRDPTHPNIGIETAMARLETDLSLQIRLAVLSRIQESEADQIGMILTQRAGWPVADMVSFYRKLVDADPPRSATGVIRQPHLGSTWHKSLPSSSVNRKLASITALTSPEFQAFAVSPIGSCG